MTRALTALLLAAFACDDPTFPPNDAGPLSADVSVDTYVPEPDSGPPRDCSDIIRHAASQAVPVEWEHSYETNGANTTFTAELEPSEGSRGFEVISWDPRSSIWVTAYGCGGTTTACYDQNDQDRGYDPPARGHTGCTTHGTGRVAMGLACRTGSPTSIRVVVRNRDVPTDDPLHCAAGFFIRTFATDDPFTPSAW